MKTKGAKESPGIGNPDFVITYNGRDDSWGYPPDGTELSSKSTLKVRFVNNSKTPVIIIMLSSGRLTDHTHHDTGPGTSWIENSKCNSKLLKKGEEDGPKVVVIPRDLDLKYGDVFSYTLIAVENPCPGATGDVHLPTVTGNVLDPSVIIKN